MNYEDRLEAYKKAIAKCTDFELKGKSMPYTSANGHMFSQLNKDGELGIRFSKEVQAQYMKEWDSTNYKSYGAVMRGYVLVPDDFWSDLDALARYLREGHAYVMSLEPK